MKEVIFERESLLSEYGRPEWMEVYMIHDEEANVQISLQKEMSAYSVQAGDITLCCSFRGIVVGFHEGRDEICMIPVTLHDYPTVVLPRESPIADFLEAARIMTGREEPAQQEYDQQHSQFITELETLLARYPELGVDALLVRPVKTEHGTTREITILQPNVKYVRHVDRPIGVEWAERDLHVFEQAATFLQVVGDPLSDYDQAQD